MQATRARAATRAKNQDWDGVVHVKLVLPTSGEVLDVPADEMEVVSDYIAHRLGNGRWHPVFRDSVVALLPREDGRIAEVHPLPAQVLQKRAGPFADAQERYMRNLARQKDAQWVLELESLLTDGTTSYSGDTFFPEDGNGAQKVEAKYIVHSWVAKNPELRDAYVLVRTSGDRLNVSFYSKEETDREADEAGASVREYILSGEADTR